MFTKKVIRKLQGKKYATGNGGPRDCEEVKSMIVHLDNQQTFSKIDIAELRKKMADAQSKHDSHTNDLIETIVELKEKLRHLESKVDKNTSDIDAQVITTSLMIVCLTILVAVSFFVSDD